MDEIDKKRKEEFKRHEMDKEHKRRKHEKTLDEEKRKLEAQERKRLREKHHADAKRVNHPVCLLNVFKINIYLVSTVHLSVYNCTHAWLIVQFSMPNHGGILGWCTFHAAWIKVC